MSVQLLKLSQKNVSLIAVLTGAMVVSQYAVGGPLPRSPECQNRFSDNPAYLEICNQYPKGKVKVLSKESDLATQIEQEPEDWLLIIPSGIHSLTKPLKSKSGQGLLPDTGDGFIRLEPTGAYAVEGDLFMVFEMGENSRQGGIEIDVSSFTSSTAFTNAKTNGHGRLRRHEHLGSGPNVWVGTFPY